MTRNPENQESKPNFRHLLMFLWQKFKGLQLWQMIGGIVAFAAAIVTLWLAIHSVLRPNEYNVYILHPRVGSGGWADFRTGVEKYLGEIGNGAAVSGAPLKVDKFELSFKALQWEYGKTDELARRFEEVLLDDKALAVIAATTSEEARQLLDPATDERRPPMLLATATNSHLLERPGENADEVAVVPRVFRMVPRNDNQAALLRDSIKASEIPLCKDNTSDIRSVIILREEEENAAFSRDLSDELSTDLEREEGIDLLANGVVDSALTVPQELVDLHPHALVYIGVEERAAVFYRQFQSLNKSESGRPCTPALLLTDAGILLADGSLSYNGLIDSPSMFVTLPFLNEGGDLPPPVKKASFYTLGHDSAKLVHEAALWMVEVGQARFGADGLVEALRQIIVEGLAHDYEFTEKGENIRADFHLWHRDNGKLRHAGTCRAKGHSQGACDCPGSSQRNTLSEMVHGSDSGYLQTGTLRVGAKAFPEQDILAEMAVRLLNESGIDAERGMKRKDVYRLLLQGRVDAYWEYTGTAFRRDGLDHENMDFHSLREADSQVFWFEPHLHFDNTYRFITTKEFGTSLDINTIEDLARYVDGGGEAVLCSNPVWFLRDGKDGFSGLEDEYDVSWPYSALEDVPINQLYDKLGDTCDVIVGFNTDGELHESDNLHFLEDDRDFFPAYSPALVIRRSVYDKLKEDHHSELNKVRERLRCVASHLEGEEAMRQLNARVAVHNESAKRVVQDFLKSECPAS